MTDHVFKWTEFALGHGTRLLAILLIAFLLIRLLRGLTQRLVKPAGVEIAGRVARMREQHTQTLAGCSTAPAPTIIVIVAVLTALPEFGFTVTPVAAAAGLASLAVGFGAQHLVRDFINGFFTVFEDQYVVGDTVRIGDVVGRVEHLSLRRTLIRDTQGALVTIPNGEINKVANLSRDWGQLFLDTVVANGPIASNGACPRWKMSPVNSVPTLHGRPCWWMDRACWAWSRSRPPACPSHPGSHRADPAR